MQGVIFDLDGVLVSTDELHYQAWKKLADELGITDFNREDNVRQRGVSRMASLEVVLEKGDKEYSEEEKVEMAERKNDYYKEMLQSLDDSAVLPGAFDTLKMLRDRGILTAVGSASKNAPLILEKTGLLPLIDNAAKAGGMKSLGVGPFHDELGADFHSRTLATVDNWEEILC